MNCFGYCSLEPSGGKRNSFCLSSNDVSPNITVSLLIWASKRLRYGSSVNPGHFCRSCQLFEWLWFSFTCVLCKQSRVADSGYNNTAQTAFQPLFSLCRNKKASSYISVSRWLSEPKPRFELGTPSLRVKCSTAELFRPFAESQSVIKFENVDLGAMCNIMCNMTACVVCS